MKNKENDISHQSNILEEEAAKYGHSEAVETERRRKALMMTDMEKFLNFSKMLRRGIMFKNAVITHKPISPNKE